jgi:GNAT superfamily N-acetyltransferase
VKRLHFVLRWDTRPPRLPLPAEVSVRQLSADDSEALGSLFYQGFRDSPDDECETPEEARTLVDGTLAGRWGDLLPEGCLIAQVGREKVAATILVADWAHDRLPLLAFAVTDPDWQRRGIGASLILSSAAALHGLGIRELHLAVLPGSPAISFYERLGFVEVRDTNDSTGGKDDATIATCHGS